MAPTSPTPQTVRRKAPQTAQAAPVARTAKTAQSAVRPGGVFLRDDDNLAARPRGVLARPIAAIMAGHNAPITRLAVEQLDPRPGEAVLDIGFGPGHSVELLAARVAGGLVAGVELSADMVRIAERRNRAAIQAGRVVLVAGSVSELPFDDGRFAKAVASNTVQFWPDLRANLREVRRVLHPGGLLVLGLRRASGRGIGYGPKDVERLAATVRSAGFVRTSVVTAEKAIALRAVS